jgi:PAS domain S-box-containing protein
MEDEVQRGHPALSEREEQVLRLAMKGFTDTAIAHQLGISEATVGTYWGRVRIKLGPYSRTELVARALQEETRETVGKLQVENARLISQMQELDFENVDEHSINFAMQLIENAPDAMLVVNEKGTIEFVNGTLLGLFGYDRDELLGERVTKLIPERFWQIHDTHRADYISNPEKRKMGEHLATAAVKKDGTEFLVAAALSAIQSPNGLMVTCILREAVVE